MTLRKLEDAWQIGYFHFEPDGPLHPAADRKT
jgi:hypothetical protein